MAKSRATLCEQYLGGGVKFYKAEGLVKHELKSCTQLESKLYSVGGKVFTVGNKDESVFPPGTLQGYIMVDSYP